MIGGGWEWDIGNGGCVEEDGVSPSTTEMPYGVTV